ncbi:conserved hypothetical protein [Candida dubliniensis CD36]|uniref:POU-specific domain-containing protein n=1 Tax=Candida dubliniensis (strain CD36 / ATCC MYA-646 / CBS 7987 / NCPF 3949 / NRRL Y-17841) TaxID=573826 RepID=B9WLU2_CANDC|nr:conserved hypothetical protein [Candida dubliniensis CD36]CAX40054.1 conserved hypothetical protein [Candida dubliniensis CD36]
MSLNSFTFDEFIQIQVEEYILNEKRRIENEWKLKLFKLEKKIDRMQQILETLLMSQRSEESESDKDSIDKHSRSPTTLTPLINKLENKTKFTTPPPPPPPPPHSKLQIEHNHIEEYLKTNEIHLYDPPKVSVQEFANNFYPELYETPVFHTMSQNSPPHSQCSITNLRKYEKMKIPKYEDDSDIIELNEYNKQFKQ